MHDVAQKTYDDLAALVALFVADTQARSEKLLQDMHAVSAASDAAMITRLRGWRGEEDKKAPTEGGVNYTTGGREPAVTEAPVKGTEDAE